MTEEVATKMVMEIHKPGLREKIFFLISGVIVSVPLTFFVQNFAADLGAILPVFSSMSFSAVVLAPLIEEFAKALPLVYRHGETERSIFTLGLLVGLGFGITEFVLYTYAFQVLIPTRILGIFFHAASTSITVFGIARRRFLHFYLIAAFLHFLNNFIAEFVAPLWFIGGVVVALSTYFLSWNLYKKSTEEFVRT